MKAHAHPVLHMLVALMLAVGGVLVSPRLSGEINVAMATGSWTSPVGLPLGTTPFGTYWSIGLGDELNLSVDLSDGNLMLTSNEMDLPGVNGFDQTITPVYNAFLQGFGTDLGDAWTLGTGRDVGLEISSSPADFVDGTGADWTFTKSGSTYTAPPGIDASLVQHSGGAYTLTFNQSGAADNFDSNGYLTSIEDRSGNSISYAYNASGQLTTIANTEGQSTSVAYNGNGTIATITDPDSRVWTYGYDASENLTSIENPSDETYSFTYDTVDYTYIWGVEELSAITDPNGNQTLIDYSDPCSRFALSIVCAGGGLVADVVRVTNSSSGTGPTTYFSGFDALGTTETDVEDANGNTTTYDFSGALLTSTTTPLGHETDQTWTSDDHIASTTTPSGHETDYSYDSNNNLTETTLPTGATEHWAYANSSFPYLPSSSTDDNGNTTTYTYNSQGLQTSSTDANSDVTNTTYNSNGTVATSTDPDGNVTTYSYFASSSCGSGSIAGFLHEIDYPHATGSPSPLGSDTYTYDCADRTTSELDGNGDLTTTTYDAMDRTTATIYDDGTAQDYTYDGDGNVTQLDDVSASSTDSDTTYTYNALNEQTEKESPDSSTVATTYDDAGNQTSMTDSGGEVDYGYNDDNLMTSVTDPQSNETTLSYDQDGQNTAIAYPNGVTESSTYDTSGNLTEIAATTSSTTLESFDYSYTIPSTSTQTETPYTVTDASGDTTTYAYDPAENLADAVQKDGGGTTISSDTYAYDGAGNMTSEDLNGATTTMSYNDVNELTTANLTAYSYDANGNETSGTGGETMTYNDQNQTTSVTPPSSAAITMAYTGPGQDERTQNGATTYQYADAGVGDVTTGSRTTYYTTTPAGLDLSERIPGGATGCSGSSGTWCAYYYLYDGEGSVVGLTSSSGTLVDSIKYDSYGNVVASTGTVPNQLGFQGNVTDSNTGLDSAGSGYYDPTTGTTTQASSGKKDTCNFDPISLGTHVGPGDGNIQNAIAWVIEFSCNYTMTAGYSVLPMIQYSKTKNGSYSTYAVLGDDMCISTKSVPANLSVWCPKNVHFRNWGPVSKQGWYRGCFEVHVYLWDQDLFGDWYIIDEEYPLQCGGKWQLPLKNPA